MYWSQVNDALKPNKVLHKNYDKVKTNVIYHKYNGRVHEKVSTPVGLVVSGRRA